MTTYKPTIVRRADPADLADADQFWTSDWADFLDEQGVDYSHLTEWSMNSRELRKLWNHAGRPGEES